MEKNVTEFIIDDMEQSNTIEELNHIISMYQIGLQVM